MLPKYTNTRNLTLVGSLYIQQIDRHTVQYTRDNNIHCGRYQHNIQNNYTNKT